MIYAMNAHDVVALNLYANDGHIDGRTTLQKLSYFQKLILQEDAGRAVDISFVPHYYGPYSKHVAAALADLVSFECVDERRCKDRAYEQYAYSLTRDDGQKFAQDAVDGDPDGYGIIKRVVDQCRDSCDLQATALSYAAKTHYLLDSSSNKHSASDIDTDKIRDAGIPLGWNMNDDNVKNGVDLLVNLELVAR